MEGDLDRLTNFLKGITHMKKFVTLMLGMALTFGTVTVAFAADEKKTEEKKEKKEKKKKEEKKPA